MNHAYRNGPGISKTYNKYVYNIIEHVTIIYYTLFTGIEKMDYDP